MSEARNEIQVDGSALVFFAAVAVRAQDVDIPYQKFVLDNGLTVIVHEDHKAPIVAVNTWYHVGIKNEKPGKTGFAHWFEHLMFAEANIRRTGTSTRWNGSGDRFKWHDEQRPDDYLKMCRRRRWI